MRSPKLLVSAYAALPGHGGNPLTNQSKALENVPCPAPARASWTPGSREPHAERKDRILRVSRHNVENMIASAAARRHRRLANTEVPVRGGDRLETQAGRVRGPRGAMAMRAIDIQIGARAGVERLRRITPIGIARHLGQGRQPRQVTDLLQIGQLIFRTRWVAVVAIEMTGFEPNRLAMLLAFKSVTWHPAH